MKRTHLQLAYSVNAPPSSRPRTDPTPAIEPYTPSALVRAGPAGKVVASSDRAPGAAIAAPQPWTRRAMISTVPFGARPPAIEATAKTTTPMRNMRKRPKRSPARPPASSSPPKVNA